MTFLRTMMVAGALGASPVTQAASVVKLNVPLLATAGSASGYRFMSFQFDAYLVPFDSGGPSDYAANVIANGRENYTFLRPSGCGSGRGGGYCVPGPYPLAQGFTYSDAYTQVTSPPSGLDIFFHFSGADVAGIPLTFNVQDSGRYSLTLTKDAGRVPVDLGAPLTNGLYTLEYRTDNLSEVVSFSAVIDRVGPLRWVDRAGRSSGYPEVP